MPIDRTVPHTVWWWDDREAEHVPVPFSKTFDNADEAEDFAHFIVAQADERPWIAWTKVFRASNETYQTFFWERPPPDEGAESAEKAEPSPASKAAHAQRVANCPACTGLGRRHSCGLDGEVG